MAEQDIDKVFIAGAFGTYLDVESGIDIGMFLRLEKERFVQVGNAAGTGASWHYYRPGNGNRLSKLPGT